jgi:hypothetical protein
VLSACSDPDRVSLTVDFAARPEWKYDCSVRLGGRVSLGDSATAFTQTLTCTLAGTSVAADPSVLYISATGVAIGSPAFDEEEIAYMTGLLEDTRVSFSLKEGLRDEGDTTLMRFARAGQWDLYRHFAKLLPILPQRPVSPGFTWERQKQIPLFTNQGDAVGHLYRSFRFDSLGMSDHDTRLAYLSWEFMYLIDAHGVDTASLIDDLPHKGSGTGAAVLDIDRKMLLEASARFAMPLGQASNAWGIEFSEEVSMKLAGE